MTTPRTAYKPTRSRIIPGSDLAGETAAAICWHRALAFKPYNSSYSKSALTPMQNRGCRLVRLYRATDDEYFLKYVVDNA
ncbi:hypothetical protein NC652_018277 [Populus alba x Populus x berolinensis]|nr:hypothetical protein NC652_018277 [Populus alba x Populus x berolinensis]